MMEERGTFRAYMKSAGEEFEEPRNSCLSEVELIDYHVGKGDERQRDRVQSHLVSCEHCQGVLLDISHFFSEPTATEQESVPSGREVEQEWESLKERIAGRRSLGHRVPVWLPVAASLVLAVALGWAVVSLRSSEERNRQLIAQLDSAQKARVPAPAQIRLRLDASIHDVFSTQFFQRSGETRQTNAIVTEPTASVTLILNGAGQAKHSGYAVEITGRDGQTVWRGEGLRRGSDGNYIMTLPGDFLKPGEYTFRVLGQTGTSYREVGQYLISWKTK